MVAQVLTSSESDIIDSVIYRLGKYSRPVKTKHLADRVHEERSDLVKILNKLRLRGVIEYTKEINKKQDHRGRDDLSYGWVLIQH